MKKYFSSLFLFGAFLPLLLLSSCEEWSFDSDATAVTKEASDITSSKAVVSCLANVEQGEAIEYGVMYSTDKAKLEAHEGDIAFTSEIAGNEYKVTLRGLRSNKTYYYCAVVRIKLINNYGKVELFKTDKPNENHEYVDLGLPSGTLWATCNIGANNPEDYGDYFAWGETTLPEDNSYLWTSYKWSNSSNNTSLTKYCNDSYYGNNGFTDNLTELELSDDAAYVNWGSSWRMPNKEQFDELINSSYTTIEWATLNGVNGRKITSKSNGRTLFFPAAGSRYDSSLGGAGSFGYYWSRMLPSDGPYVAWVMCFSSYSVLIDGNSRSFGLSIRPVRSPE